MTVQEAITKLYEIRRFLWENINFSSTDDLNQTTEGITKIIRLLEDTL